MDCGCPTAYRGCVGSLFVARKRLLKLLHPRAQPDPIAAQAIDYRSNFGLANLGRAEDEAVLRRAHSGASRDCGLIVLLHWSEFSASQRSAFHRFVSQVSEL